MSGAAGAIHFARRYAGETKAWSFLAPNGSVAVPHSDGCATEGLAGRHH